MEDYFPFGMDCFQGRTVKLPGSIRKKIAKQKQNQDNRKKKQVHPPKNWLDISGPEMARWIYPQSCPDLTGSYFTVVPNNK